MKCHGAVRIGLFIATLAALCGSSTVLATASSAKSRRCDDSIKAAFKPDKLTTVVVVKAFRKGDWLVMSEPGTPYTPKAASDLCLVKLIVGPGHPGPADAPSTSPGIGIEVWLPTPAHWNRRVHALGGGGWVGGPAGSARAIQDTRGGEIAGTEGAVTSVTDAGHPREGGYPGAASGGGDFAMNPDGTLNQVLLQDFASRSMHEQALKTKALATLYYGRAAQYSYWDGGSNGGRQALELAQNHPQDFDGILANFPAINWTSFMTADVYPQIVFQRDLAGVPLTEAQQDLVSNAAIHACDVVGGQHLGYVLDDTACRYDPTRDAAVLCQKDGGTNTTPACVGQVQAAAFNKIWYGMTADGSVPAPSVDNGWDHDLGGVRRWYGVPRGTSLYDAFFTRLTGMNAGLTNVSGPFTHATDGLALELQNPTMASGNFRNATGNGADLWKTLSYAQLSNAFDRGLALQSVLGHGNSDNPDLSGFKARGGKMLTWHGMNDEVIPVQGTIHYYNRVVDRMGGLAVVQSFYKLYLAPGNGHAAHNGTSNPNANPPIVGATQFYDLLVNWVEHGVAPDRVEIETPPQAAVRRSTPICPYPQKATYQGGDPRVTTSFTCS